MRFNRQDICLAVILAGLLWPSAALAYIGPGAGLSAIGTAIAAVGAFFLLIVGFIWYPIKRLLRKRRVAEAQPRRDE